MFHIILNSKAGKRYYIGSFVTYGDANKYRKKVHKEASGEIKIIKSRKLNSRTASEIHDHLNVEIQVIESRL